MPFRVKQEAGGDRPVGRHKALLLSPKEVSQNRAGLRSGNDKVLKSTRFASYHSTFKQHDVCRPHEMILFTDDNKYITRMDFKPFERRMKIVCARP
jgi:hypothetical protein